MTVEILVWHACVTVCAVVQSRKLLLTKVIQAVKLKLAQVYPALVGLDEHSHLSNTLADVRVSLLVKKVQNSCLALEQWIGGWIKFSFSR